MTTMPEQELIVPSRILRDTNIPDNGCIDVGIQTEMSEFIMSKFRHVGGSDPNLRTYTEEMLQSELAIAIKIGSRLTRQ